MTKSDPNSTSDIVHQDSNNPSTTNINSNTTATFKFNNNNNTNNNNNNLSHPSIIHNTQSLTANNSSSISFPDHNNTSPLIHERNISVESVSGGSSSGPGATMIMSNSILNGNGHQRRSLDEYTEKDDSDDDDGESSLSPRQREKRSGRRKIRIEFIDDRSRRHITFSKRKAGIMKKAYELSTLTGTQVLLLVASETGHVYTFATPKLQPLITKPEGKNLIQACLNAPDNYFDLESLGSGNSLGSESCSTDSFHHSSGGSSGGNQYGENVKSSSSCATEATSIGYPMTASGGPSGGGGLASGASGANSFGQSYLSPHMTTGQPPSNCTPMSPTGNPLSYGYNINMMTNPYMYTNSGHPMIRSPTTYWTAMSNSMPALPTSNNQGPSSIGSMNASNSNSSNSSGSLSMAGTSSTASPAHSSSITPLTIPTTPNMNMAKNGPVPFNAGNNVPYHYTYPLHPPGYLPLRPSANNAPSTGVMPTNNAIHPFMSSSTTTTTTTHSSSNSKASLSTVDPQSHHLHHHHHMLGTNQQDQQSAFTSSSLSQDSE